ncbi:hypothetical protein H2200_012516 [Cladophialophora chaetospira]|uniref:Uncharacterized protein n=1 Tax=Cladophialophora chaetospira TaxID=386627 RepID=A0AA38WXZ1_9EURO|nr:hypothetical protein H2200_012516 [Cladophialophora chaetospira]
MSENANGSDEHPQEISALSSSGQDAGIRHDSGGSPQRPSYSPVTPTLSQASLVSQDATGVNLPPPQWMDENPEPLPLSLDDNPDAIALRATLSILQIQRQQALRDMRELDKIKKMALENPEDFVGDLQAGKMSRPPRTGVEVDEVEAPDTSEKETSKFGQLPAAQNIVRSPPIEWSKYHVVGEPLERIHQLQRQYPGASEQVLEGQTRPQPHAIAAPYRPFADKLEDTKQSANARTNEF